MLFPVLFILQVTVVKNHGKFGVKLSNGTLTGALGNLQRRKSDIAMTAFFMKVVKKFYVAGERQWIHAMERVEMFEEIVKLVGSGKIDLRESVRKSFGNLCQFDAQPI